MHTFSSTLFDPSRTEHTLRQSRRDKPEEPEANMTRIPRNVEGTINLILDLNGNKWLWGRKHLLPDNTYNVQLL